MPRALHLFLMGLLTAILLHLLAWGPPTLGAYDPCPTPDMQATAIWAAVDPTRTEIAHRADELRARPNRPAC